MITDFGLLSKSLLYLVPPSFTVTEANPAKQFPLEFGPLWNEESNLNFPKTMALEKMV